MSMARMCMPPHSDRTPSCSLRSDSPVAVAVALIATAHDEGAHVLGIQGGGTDEQGPPVGLAGLHDAQRQVVSPSVGQGNEPTDRGVRRRGPGGAHGYAVQIDRVHRRIAKVLFEPPLAVQPSLSSRLERDPLRRFNQIHARSIIRQPAQKGIQFVPASDRHNPVGS